MKPKQKVLRHILLVWVVIGLTFSGATLATDVSENANYHWMNFAFGQAGSEAYRCPSYCPLFGNVVAAPSAPWEFWVDEGGTGEVTVQDIFAIGDQFAVYDNGVLLGVTSVPGPFALCSPDPDICATNQNASRGSFAVSSGYHAITIVAIISPFQAGVASFRIDGDIPGGQPPIQDSDADGITDDNDRCVMSDLAPTVVIADCDSGVVNTLFADGCTISDRVQECGNGVRNHGLNVSCTADLLNQMMKADEIEQKGAIQSCVAQDN